MIKYLNRLVHLFAFMFLFSENVVEYYFNHSGIVNKVVSINRTRPFYMTNLFLSVVLTFSGLLSFFFTISENKYRRNTNYSFYKSLILLKVFLTIFITPALEKIMTPFSIVMKTGKVDTYCSNIRLFVTLFMIMISPFLYYFREHYLTVETKGWLAPESKQATTPSQTDAQKQKGKAA